MSLSFRSAAVAVVVLWSAVFVHAGGWSIITVNDFPEYAVSGQPLTLTFSVRQHGNNLLRGLTPLIEATAPGQPAVAASGIPTATGEYSATLRFPASGTWRLRVDSGFNPNDTSRRFNALVLPELVVLPDVSAAFPIYSDAERGSRLMTTKGCVGCHGPGGERELAGKRFDAEYLRAFLANPAIRTADMPNLHLKEAEISALIAFINGSRPKRAGS